MATDGTSLMSRAAYLVAYFVALFVGIVLVDTSVWLRTIIGVLIVLPAVVVDWYLSSGRTNARTD